MSRDYESLSDTAADRFVDEFRQKPESLVGLATGGTPEGLYQRLVARHRADPTLFSQARWIVLDEWGGLEEDDPATCGHYLQTRLFEPLNVGPGRICRWSSQPFNPQEECRRVEKWLADEGPIDLQVLGLGKNGHLGFNEPGRELIAGPHVATLTEESLTHAMLSTARSRPTFGLTLGMGEILRSRQILLLVSGGAKSQQVLRLASGNITSEFPASLLHCHGAVTVYCDLEAASVTSFDASAMATATGFL